MLLGPLRRPIVFSSGREAEEGYNGFAVNRRGNTVGTAEGMCRIRLALQVAPQRTRRIWNMNDLMAEWNEFGTDVDTGPSAGSIIPAAHIARNFLMALRYVLLRFSPPDSRQIHASIPLVVLQESQSRLQTYIQAGWDQHLRRTDREYLLELIADWHNATNIPGLLDELSELSIGPLVSVESGLLDAVKRDKLMSVVGRNSDSH